MAEKLPSNVYDTVLDYMKMNLLQSSCHVFEQGGWYKLLPPRLQKKLVNVVMQKHHASMKYYFTDVVNKESAEEGFIHKVLISLSAKTYITNEIIT